MNINEEIVKFVISARNKIAEYGQRRVVLIENGQERTKEYEELTDKTEFLDWVIDAVYNTRYKIVDDNMNPVTNFFGKTDAEMMKMLSDWRYLFQLDVYPYSDIALHNMVVQSESSIFEQQPSGSGLPTEGRVPNYILTIGQDGNAYWAAPTVYFEVINY